MMPTLARFVARAALRAVLLLLPLTFTGGDGCQPWWDTYKPPPEANTCPSGQSRYLCACVATWSNGDGVIQGSCAMDPSSRCATDLHAAQHDEKKAQDIAVEQMAGQSYAATITSCTCTSANSSGPTTKPQTSGDPMPECSAVFAGGGASCLADGTACTYGNDCCSGICNNANVCNSTAACGAGVPGDACAGNNDCASCLCAGGVCVQ